MVITQLYHGFVIIVLLKFLDQDIIELSSCFLYICQPVEFFNVMCAYMYIYIYIVMSQKCMNHQYT